MDTYIIGVLGFAETIHKYHQGSSSCHHGKVLLRSGVYYLADVLEIALLVGESGNLFHSYVRIHYSVPKRVQQLTGITNRIIKSLVVPFRDVVNGLVGFLQHEQAQSKTPIPIVIAHGEYLHDFPILLANCMKHNCDNCGILRF